MRVYLLLLKEFLFINCVVFRRQFLSVCNREEFEEEDESIFSGTDAAQQKDNVFVLI